MDIFWNTTIEDPWHVQLHINVKSTMAHQCTFRYLHGVNHFTVTTAKINTKCLLRSTVIFFTSQES